MGNKAPTSRRLPSARSFRRRAYLVFLLSSVIPLAFLAVLADNYAIPTLSGTNAATLTFALAMVGVLAILSFALLAQATAGAIAHIEGSNRQLRLLVEAAHALSDSRFADVVAEETVKAGAGLVDASAGFVFRTCSTPAQRTAPATTGEQAARLAEARRDALLALSDRIHREQTPLLWPDDGNEMAPEVAGVVGRIDERLTISSLIAAPLATQGQTFGTLLLLRGSPRQAFTRRDLDLATMLGQHVGVALHNACLQDAEKNFFTHVTELLVQALDLHVDHHAGHSKGVAHLASLMAHELGLEPRRTERLFFAALLHDVGMLRLDDEAMADDGHLRAHPELGASMVEPITLWSDLAPIILHHHERMDGQGYPQGLHGEEIPLESRVIAVADAYDTMTRPGSYQATYTPAEALGEMRKHAGTQFDPDVVAALIRAVGRESAEA